MVKCPISTPKLRVSPLSEFISGNCWLAFSQYQTKSKVNPKLLGSPVQSENGKWTKIYFLPAITASIILISNIVLTIFRISGCVLWYTAEIRKGNLWRGRWGRVRTIFAGDNKIIQKKYMLSNNLNLDTTNCFIGSNIIRIYLHLRLTIPNLLPSGPSKSDPLAD